VPVYEFIKYRIQACTHMDAAALVDAVVVIVRLARTV